MSVEGFGDQARELHKPTSPEHGYGYEYKRPCYGMHVGTAAQGSETGRAEFRDRSAACGVTPLVWVALHSAVQFGLPLPACRALLLPLFAILSPDHSLLCCTLFDFLRGALQRPHPWTLVACL